MTISKMKMRQPRQRVASGKVRRVTGGLAMVAAMAAAGLPAAAQDTTGWYLQLGAANVAFSEGAGVSAGGSRIPGASATLSDSTTLALGIGYRFANDFSVIGIAGVPPTTTVSGTGPLAGVSVGEITYGPLVVAANYHIPTAGAFQPFIGAGVSYTRIFEARGEDISGLSADDAFGGVLRRGLRLHVQRPQRVLLLGQQDLHLHQSIRHIPGLWRRPGSIGDRPGSADPAHWLDPSFLMPRAGPNGPARTLT